MTGLVLLPITAADAPQVARLHADSWRSAYRGILSDHYLDRQADAERASTWEARLSVADPACFGLMAWQGSTPAGFVYVVCDADPVFGALIDNLHVRPALRSAGIGAQLLAGAAAGIMARAMSRRAHLWVYDANVRARAFYARMGGAEVESTMKASVEGVLLPESRVSWPDVQTLRG